MRVAAAEEGPLLRVSVRPSVRLVRAAVRTTAEVPLAAAPPAGPWSEVVLGSLTASGTARVLAVEPPPDGALRSLDPDRVGLAVEGALEALRGLPAPDLLVTTADDLLGRPFSGASAAVSGAVSAWARALGVPVLALGPLAERQAAPHLGVHALTAGDVTAAIGAALAARAPRVALRVDWRAALAAFPHLRELGAELAAPPRRAEVVDAVREEVARIVGEARPALAVPVRELGLDSVGAVQLRVELERRFGVSLPATLVFEHPTIASVAERVLATLSAARSGSRR